jgi:hypothetical protein
MGWRQREYGGGVVGLAGPGGPVRPRGDKPSRRVAGGLWGGDRSE